MCIIAHKRHSAILIALQSACCIQIRLKDHQLCCLYRNQRKKKALADTKDAYNKLLADNTALLKQLQDTQRDSYAVTEHFRKEVLGKNERIAELQAQVEQVRS